MSTGREEGRWKFAFGIMVLVALLTIAGWGWIRSGAERIWSLPDVREARHDLVETVDPLEMGPTQEARGCFFGSFHSASITKRTGRRSSRSRSWCLGS